MALRSKDELDRLRLLGQYDLGALAEILTGTQFWSIQQRIMRAASVPRAKVAVPSCNASGKTHLAGGGLALAFYFAFTPGAPCVQCDPHGDRGGCRGSKIITTSSKYDHLRDNLWGELRTAYHRIKERGFDIPGRLLEADLRLVENESNHFIVGQSAATAEGMQGYHAAHKLIIGDEATSVDEEVQLAITRLLASSDSRIVLIFNPTTPDTYASQMSRSPGFETIRITAFDTPAFTGEPMPEGANLITQAFLDDLVSQGMGPGTFMWQTSIEARDWDLGDDLLVNAGWYDLAASKQRSDDGTRQLGIDIATYGSDENVIALREGSDIVEVRSFPSMRPDTYVQGPVTKAVMDFRPHTLVFDGDGPGAGMIGMFEALAPMMGRGSQIVPFRGGKAATNQRFINQRSAWYWSLRRRFENQGIGVCVNDEKLRSQLIDIHYTVTDSGDIRVETKKEMKKRGNTSPDRADAVMYAFAYSDEFASAMAHAERKKSMADLLNLPDYSLDAMYARRRAPNRNRPQPVNPVTGVSDDF